jgi:DNA polymerase-3 subunit gamma/tau
MLDRFRDLIVLASVPDAIATGLLDVPPDRADILTAQAGRSGLATLTRAAEIISAGLDQMRGATSPRLLLELVCAQVLLPAAATDERSLLARLERLETGAANVVYAERVPLPPHNPPAREPGRPDGVPSQAAAAAPATPAAQPAAQPRQTAQPQRPAAQPPQPAPSRRAEPSAPRGSATADTLRQGWDGVLDAVKAKRRVAWMLLSNASVVSLDEGVLVLRFPRQGDVKGFQSSGYEELLKQVLHARFGVNVVVRAISGGDPPAGERRRPGPEPVPPAPSPAPTPSPAPPAQPPAAQPPRQVAPQPPPAPPAGAGGSEAGTTRSFGDKDVPFPSDEDFDPDDEDMAVPTSAELTGMALVQRELGGQIIGEFED